MPNNSRDDVGTYVYTDDAARLWSVHLTNTVAAACGFPLLSNQAVVGAWHQGRDKMRHVGIKRPGNGKILRDKVPCPTNTETHYQLGTKTLSLDGVTWTITGRIGEKKGL